KAADAKIALDIVTDAILSAPEIISEKAQTAFEAAAEVSDTATDRDVKVAVEGDRTLLTANLALAVARRLARDAERVAPPPQSDQPPTSERQGEPEKSKAEKRQRRARRTKADEPSWQALADKFQTRFYGKLPIVLADAALASLANVIRHGPTTAGLAAVLALGGLALPIAAGGALATTIGWIVYRLHRGNKRSSSKDSVD